MRSFMRANPGRRRRAGYYGEPSKTDVTGHQFEEARLYEGKVNLPDVRTIKGLPLRDAFIQCLTSNPYAYSEELKPSVWMNDIHSHLAQILNTNIENIHIYPSVGIPLDKHGIDFVIIYIDPDTGRRVIITVDLTVNEIKYDGGYKADVIVSSTGAAPHEYHYSGIDGFDLRVEHTRKYEEAELEEARREGIANVIANVINHKLTHGDSHYEYVIGKMRNDLDQLFGEEVVIAPVDDIQWGRNLANTHWPSQNN